MKKFSKLFLSCAAVAALTAAVATSAMAEEVAITGEVSGTYDTTTGVISVTAPTGIAEGTQATLLVYKNGSATEISADSIVGIDQAAGAAFTNNGLKGTPTKENEGKGTYTVMLGYTTDSGFVTKKGTLPLSNGIEVLIGDANQDALVTNNDAKLIMQVNAHKAEFTGNGEIAADVNMDTLVTNNDAKFIMQKNAKIDNENNQYVGTTQIVTEK